MSKIEIDVLTKIDDARSDLRKLDASVESVDKTVKDMAGSMKSAETSLDGFSGSTANLANVMSAVTNGIDTAQQIVGALKDVFDATVVKAAEWGDSMGDLAALTGQTVEETSRLAATMELVGIDASSLGRILKSMTKEGLNLNLDTLLKLNKQYNALTDPVEKNTFLFKNFGRAAEDMAEVMGRSEAELRQLMETADKSGKVIGEDAAEAAETLNTQMAALEQRMEGANIQLGTAAITLTAKYAPAIRDANNAISRFIFSLAKADSPMAAFGQFIVQGTLVREFANALDTQTKAVVEQTEAVYDGTRAADAWGDRWAGIAREAMAKKAADDAKQAQIDLRKELDLLNAALSGAVSDEFKGYYDAQGDLGKRGQELRTEIDKLTESHGQYYQATIDGGTSAAELEVATLKLAEAEGKLSQETDPLKAAELRVEIEKQQKTISGATTVVDGYIDNSEKISELSKEWDEVTAALEANRQAHDESAKAIVFDLIQQQYAIDGYTTEELASLTDLGVALGVYDQDTANVMKSVQDSITTSGTVSREELEKILIQYGLLRDEPDIVKNVTVKYQKVGDEDFGGWTPTPGSPAPTPTPSTDPLDPGLPQSLDGGQSIAPGGSTGSDTRGNVNITINAGNASAKDVAREVQAIIADQFRQNVLAGV